MFADIILSLLLTKLNNRVLTNIPLSIKLVCVCVCVCVCSKCKFVVSDFDLSILLIIYI